MSPLPKVCVLIPTYNQQHFIKKAVESALAQDYANLEIIVADDCSGGDMYTLLKPYLARKNFFFRSNEKNIGRVANYRKALYQYTSAEWIINLDGDDYFTNNFFISEAIQAIEEYGFSRVFFFQGSHIYKKGAKEVIQKPHIKNNDLCIACNEYFYDFFRYRHFSHMSTLFNRQLAVETGFYSESATSSDIFSFLKGCVQFKDKKIILSKNISGVWLQHRNNASTRINNTEQKNNTAGYITLYRLAKKSGFDNTRLLAWLGRVRYNTLKTRIKMRIMP